MSFSQESRPSVRRILLVSQHPLAREGLKRLLELESHGAIEVQTTPGRNALRIASVKLARRKSV